MIESPKNFIEQFQNFIEHIAGVMKTFLTKEVADNYYLGKSEKASSASLADTATKATQDANGNVIPETYATKSELTSGLATKQPVGDYRTKSELDSIYLGINAKAKSAVIADSVESIDFSKVVGIDVPSVYGTRIDVSLTAYRDETKTWEAPTSGLFAIYSLSFDGDECTLNGCPISFIGDDADDPVDRDTGYFPIQKGDIVVLKGASRHANLLKAFIYPLRFTKEITKNE